MSENILRHKGREGRGERGVKVRFLFVKVKKIDRETGNV